MVAPLAIRSLRARTPADAQPVAARLALQALGADLEDALPRSLPPQALLWLRRLRLQTPEAALRRPAPPASRQDWIAAGRQAMDEALARAARPALGAVPEDAEAVLFADEAEMLACLALAARTGQLDRWWWRGQLGRAWPQWQTARAARPQAQPAAQRLLLRAGQGGAVAMPEAGGRDEVPWQGGPVRVHGATGGALPPDVALLEPSSLAEPCLPVAGHEAALPLPSDPAGLGLTPQPAPAPVHSPATLRSAVEAAASPMAPPAPDAARAASVIDARLSRLAADLPPAVPVQPPARVEGKTAAARSAPSASGTSPAGRPQEPPALPWALPPSGTATALPLRPHSAGGPAFIAPPATTRGVQEPVPARVPAGAQEPRSTLAPPHEPPVAPQPLAPAWPWPEARLSCQAPLFFLVNALLEDGLYPDFTRPRDAGLQVPLWALLAALAGTWRLPADPLRGLLSERAGDWRPVRMPAVPGASAGPWEVWLPAYARALRRRLCRRLGLRAARWPGALTLARPARLWLSEAEWVVEFDLGRHDVAWRLAGLDRDPGWLPSVGCSLRFRFD